MIIGKVISNLVSTRKYDALQGYKLLIIKDCYSSDDQYFVAADEIGAGIGEYVLVTKGFSAQSAMNKKVPIDAVVVGIIDHEPTF